MSRYRKIEVAMWGDAKFKRLSRLQPCGQALWIYLLTGTHTSIIPGLFEAGRLRLAENLGWPVSRFDRSFREIEEQGMVKADFENHLVWVPKAIGYNPPANPNVVKSWRKEFLLLPECMLKAEAETAISKALKRLGESFHEAFRPRVLTTKGFRKGLDGPSQKTCSTTPVMPLSNQEQEQKQEEENTRPPLPLPRAVGGRRLFRPFRQLAQQAASDCSIVSPSAIAILEKVMQNEVDTGAEPENIGCRLVESWKRYNLNKERLRIHWGAEKFFGEGYWKDANSWPWDEERLRMESLAKVGTYTPS